MSQLFLQRRLVTSDEVSMVSAWTGLPTSVWGRYEQAAILTVSNFGKPISW
jgi:glycerol kinase